MTLRAFLVDLIGVVLAAAGIVFGYLDAKDGQLSTTAAVAGGALLFAAGLLIDPAKATSIATAIRGALAGANSRGSSGDA